MTLTAVDAVAFPGPGSAAVGEARRDARQRMIVDAGIAMLGSSNVMSAFEYLRAHGIRAHIIERVLLEPLQRRPAA